MDYANILNDIKPTEDEMERLNEISHTLINFLNKTCMEESIDAKITLVGSVAKGTALKGKSDIDIFMAFPLDTDKQYLKEIGLYLAHKCSDNFDGEASHHFASHPYVTSIIDGFEVDFVPCYEIEDGSQLKSAVDRTILHTRYVMANLSDEQRDEVLLLKRFMDMTGTYGSEFKVGGFAGYLCELLVIYYGNFENTLKNATKWQFGQEIDLMDYGTAGQFKDPAVHFHKPAVRFLDDPPEELPLHVCFQPDMTALDLSSGSLSACVEFISRAHTSFLLSFSKMYEQ